MSIISLLLNLLWIVFGGLWMALGWVVAAVVMAITIVGLPWARAAFSIARLLFLFLVAALLSGALFVQRQFLNSVPGAIS
jgi:uncharacterized membrane protein YccF (DUF307 family)